MTRLRWLAITGVAIASPAAADDTEPAHAVVTAPVLRPPSPPPILKKAPTGTFQIGAGYDSDEGFLATARVAQSNLFGTGHGLSLEAGVSKLRQDFVIAYDIPQLGRNWDFHAELGVRTFNHPGFTTERVGGMAELGQRLDRNTRFFTRYRAEHVTVEPDVLATGRTLLGRELGNGMVSAMGAGIQWDTRDAKALPLAGSRLELFAEASTPELGSDYSFWKARASADHATPFGPFTLRLSGRTSYAESLGGRGLPLSERLLHDGNADIRGFALGSLASPWNYGANFEALGRVELELPVWKRAGLSVAGFFDAGYRKNLDPAWGPIGSALHRSAGVSIIWRSPLGPLRFDWAFPLDGKDRDARFLFGLGF